jgi:hypothetical protein
MCDFLLRDLYANCPHLAALANEGTLVYQTNFTVNEGTPAKWTIDLVIGTNNSASSLPGSWIAKADPSQVWIAIDAKAIMTEHGKARRNRQRDLNSMGEILRRMDPVPVTGAFVVINMASKFRSPLRSGITQHRNIERIVGETIPLMQEILKDEKKGRPGLDAIGVTIVNYPNTEGSDCLLVQDSPAPDSLSPLYYDAFVSRLCDEFAKRFKR